jgi:hypothetical protein
VVGSHHRRQTQTVEFFSRTRASVVRLAGASHVFTTVSSGFKKRSQDIGEAGSCNVDIKCSSLQSSDAFLNARSAVAEMVFNDASTVYLCTGTLLNDTAPSTQIPWFLSANHCFDNENPPLKTSSQMQAVASTLTTLWAFEAQSCGSTTVPPYSQLVGGSQFIYNNPRADVLFIRLNDRGPPGSVLRGVERELARCRRLSDHHSPPGGRPEEGLAGEHDRHEQSTGARG